MSDTTGIKTRTRSSDGLAINIHDAVAVRLTDHGRAIHRANRLQSATPPGEYRPPIEDADGWSNWQMWELMQEFGPHIGLGCKPCFEATIRVKANNGSKRREQAQGENGAHHVGFKVVHDGDGFGGLCESCALCRRPTRYWHPQKDVAVCKDCAATRSEADVPCKRDWLNANRGRLPLLPEGWPHCMTNNAVSDGANTGGSNV